MKDLEGNTSYYFRISAYTLAGAGPFSEKMNFTTISEIIPGPDQVGAMAITYDSILVWWEKVLEYNVSGYRVIGSLMIMKPLRPTKTLILRSIYSSPDILYHEWSNGSGPMDA